MRDNETIGLDELVDGYLKTRDESHEDHDYWVEFVDAVCGLLAGNDDQLQFDVPRSRDDEMLDQSIASALLAIPSRPSPWSGFMEAPEWVIRHSKTYGREIAAAQTVLGVVVDKYLRTLLIMRWPGIESRHVTWFELRRRGIESEPPPPREWDEW